MKAPVIIIAAAAVFAAFACTGGRNTARVGSVSEPAETATETAEDTAVYTVVEDMPLFDGKNPGESFREYVYQNLRYPLREWDYSGRVFVTFTIEKDGSVTQAKVLRGLEPLLDAEALRVIRSSSGRWMPGRQRGTPVRVSYIFPVRFYLQADDTSAQPDTSVKAAEAPTVYIVVEDMPLFDGRPPEESFHEYVAKNLRSPEMEWEGSFSGRVILEFIIEKDGLLTRAKVLRSMGTAFDAEALRVVRSSPRWTPGRLHGKPVRVKYTWPVNIHLQ
jgi:TonB family protein